MAQATTTVTSGFERTRHATWVLLGALGLTLAFFLLLPVLQAINKPPTSDVELRDASIAELPPPPPPPAEEEEEEEEEEDEPKPELDTEAPKMDLSQLALALNTGFGGDFLTGDFATRLTGGEDGAGPATFSLDDLDERPRVVYQPAPVVNNRLRAQAPATVYVIFLVSPEGRVVDPKVQRSSDPIFERAALAAVKKWKFEPGRRKGEPVQFRMRVPISFPKGL